MTQPQQLVEDALAASGADDCVVIVEEHSETNLRWAANTLTTNGQMRSRSMTVVSIVERDGAPAAGVVTRSVGSVEELDALVHASERAAREAQPADDASPLATPTDVASAGAAAKSADGRGWDEPAMATDVEIFARLAPELGEQFGRWSAEAGLLYGFAEHQLTSTFLGTSTGLRLRADEPDGRFEINGKSADGVRSAWSGHQTRDFADLDVAAVADGLAERLAHARRRTDLPPGRYETILPPTAVADLMISTYWAAGARSADEGRSVFAGADGNRIGERLSPLPLTLRSDPHEPGLQCADFEIALSSDGGQQSVFDNGCPVPATDWIRDGRLVNLLRSRAYARQTDAPPRPGVANLVLETAEADPGTLEDMIAGTERGLLLTCLWYIRGVDPQTLLLTGLTRDGVYLVENGRISGAVNNFRFNESPVDLLGRVTQVGRTSPTLSREWSDYFRRTAMPPLRVPDFNMSTVSEAN